MLVPPGTFSYFHLHITMLSKHSGGFHDTLDQVVFTVQGTPLICLRAHVFFTDFDGEIACDFFYETGSDDFFTYWADQVAHFTPSLTTYLLNARGP